MSRFDPFQTTPRPAAARHPDRVEAPGTPSDQVSRNPLEAKDLVNGSARAYVLADGQLVSEKDSRSVTGGAGLQKDRVWGFIYQPFPPADDWFTRLLRILLGK